MVNTCLKFDGVNDYVNVGNAASLNITGEITISAWVKPNVVEGEVSIFSRFSGNSGYELRVEIAYTPDRLAMIVADGTTWKLASDTGNVFSAGKWQHVVGVYDGTNVKLYLNNVLLTTTASNPPGAVSAVAYIGQRASAYYWNGSIDEVRIYNRALTAEEVLASYRGLYVSRTGLVGEWLMQEGTGSTIDDTSDESNVGTIYGASWVEIPPRIQGIQSITGINQIIF